MSAERLPLGIFTTDDRLVVRTWDNWLARVTGIEPAQALNRPLADVLPEVRTRGLLEIMENVLSRGTAEVLAAAFHHYLFAAPPSEPSDPFERMRQHVTIGPIRDDGRIVGIIVTVEDVTARLAGERRLADSVTKAGARDQTAPADGRPDVETLTRLFGAEDWALRRKAVDSLAAQGPAIVSALVRTLREQHDNFHVLSSALDLLAVSDIDVIEPLTAFLSDADANLRIQTALILGERRDKRAIPFLMARLDDEDANVRFHVIEALGRLHATEACDRLMAIAEQRDFFLSFPAIQALSHLGMASIAPRLVPLLADEFLRAPAIEALGELGDEDVAVPLVRELNAPEAPADVIATALAGLFERYESRYGAGEHIASLVRRNVSAAGTQRLLDAVQRVDADRLPGLARVLGWLEGDAVQRALTRLLGKDAVRAQVVEALVRYGAGVVALLAEQLRAEDLEIRQAAAVALGRIGDRQATTALAAALDDREVAVAAAGALARIGDPAAYEALIRRLGDPDAAIRQAVVAALNSIGHPDMSKRVAGLLDDPDPIVRESAVKVAGYFGYPDCIDRVLTRCRDEAETVRRTAVEHLVFFEDPRVFGALVEALSADAASVRGAAVAALARAEEPGRIGALLRALDDEDAWVRYLAVRALGASADAAAVPGVMAVLRDDPAPHVRLAAIGAIGRLRPDDALHILEPLSRSAADDTARAAIAALGHLGRADAIPLLEQFLRVSDPTRRLAAVDALALHRDARVPAILQWVAAADDDAAIAAAAIDALGRIGVREGPQGAEATRALAGLTAERGRREAAILALSSLPPRRIPDIASCLRQANVEVRRASVEALGRMKHPDASQAVESALDDDAAAVRMTAVGELKHLGTRASQRKLMALARTDPDGDVRRAALHAIARTDAPGVDSLGPR